MSKVETLEQFLARGGAITKIRPVVSAKDVKIPRYAGPRTRLNIKKEERAEFIALRAKAREAVANG